MTTEQHSFTFFCDASNSMGLGHYSRCKRIAKAIANETKSKISFAGVIRDELQQELRSANWNYQDCHAHELNQLDANPHSIAIIDSYTITDTALKSINKSFGATVFIDDFNRSDFSETDLVVNFRFGFDVSVYGSQTGCYGLEFFPADQEMIDVRNAQLLSETSNPIFSILLYIGALPLSSIQNTINAIDANINGANIIIVSGLHHGIKGLTSSSNTITMTPLAASLTKLIADANVVICSGGLIKYEAGFCITPNACINQTIDQYDDTVILANENLTYNFGLEAGDDSLYRNMMKEFFSPKCQREQRIAMKHHYDSASTLNIAKAIIGLIS